MPTYPLLLDAASSANTSSNAPVQLGAARYAMLTPGGGTIHVWKSIDDGLTWTDKGAVADTVTQFGGFTHDSRYLYGLSTYFDMIVGNSALLIIFDTFSDTWLPSIQTGLPLTNVNNIVYDPTDIQLIITQTFSTGHGSPNVSQYGIIDTSGTIITAMTTLGNDPSVDWLCNGILKGNGMFHFVLLSGLVFGAGTRQLCVQALPNAGTLGTVQVVDTISDGGNTPNEQAYQGACDGTTLVLGWCPTTLTDHFIIFTGPSADPFVSTNQTVSFTHTFDCFSLTRHTNTYLFVFTDDGTTGTFQLGTDTGGGFGALATLATAPVATLQPLYANSGPLVTEAWGILIDGSVYYWAPFGGPPPGPGAAFVYLDQSQAMPISLPDPAIKCRPKRPPVCSRGFVIATDKDVFYPPVYVRNA